MNDSYEENPFEDAVVAQEWINSVENEKGFIRDREIYPSLQKWAEEIQPKTIVEIGSGQGICSEKISIPGLHYIGIEPSKILTDRAKELYSEIEDRELLVGNAYALPVEDQTADAAFSVNVWFHLENLEKASSEIARILKPGGSFLIITANPEADDLWEKSFINYSKNGKILDGKVIVPVNPLSRNIIYQHTLDEIVEALKNNGFTVEKVETFGTVDDNTQDKIFINIQGKKSN